MKKSRYAVPGFFLLLGVILLLVLASSFLPTSAGTKPATPIFTNVISGSTGIYGTPFGAAQGEFIALFGEPTGQLRLGVHDSALIYGKNHAFLFRDGSLCGVRITDGVFDWKLARTLKQVTRFDSIEWKLDNGIKKGMPFPEVQKIVGTNIANNRYSFAYRTGQTYVELDFIQNDDVLDERATVNGVLVKRE